MLNKNYKNSAQVVDGKLILTFPGAVTPVVWQMDLVDVKASSIEVNDNKVAGFDLVLKTPKGESVHVASFEKKEEAVDGLMAASQAMERAHGQIILGAPSDASSAGLKIKSLSSSGHGRGILKGVLWVVGGLLVIVVLMNILASMTAGPVSNGRSFERISSVDAVRKSGVPVSADDFLRKR